jgi:hypothetical protein
MLADWKSRILLEFSFLLKCRISYLKQGTVKNFLFL